MPIALTNSIWSKTNNIYISKLSSKLQTFIGSVYNHTRLNLNERRCYSFRVLTRSDHLTYINIRHRSKTNVTGLVTFVGDSNSPLYAVTRRIIFIPGLNYSTHCHYPLTSVTTFYKDILITMKWQNVDI